MQRLFHDDFGYAAPISVRFWLCGTYFSKIWVIAVAYIRPTLVMRRLFKQYLGYAAPI